MIVELSDCVVECHGARPDMPRQWIRIDFLAGDVTEDDLPRIIEELTVVMESKGISVNPNWRPLGADE